jgi:hypothetical protein
VCVERRVPQIGFSVVVWPRGKSRRRKAARLQFTGHKSAREHQKYTHLEMDTRRAAVDKIPSLG